MPATPIDPDQERTKARELHVSDEGTGRSVLFVHGQPGLGTDFDSVAALIRGDHRILAPDRPGYGESDGEPLSMNLNARVMASLIEARGASPVTVVGHSYGGGVAILLAARRPDLVSGLVLAGSVGREDSFSVFDKLLAAPVAGEVLGAASLFTLGHVLPLLRSVASVVPRGFGERLRVSLPDTSWYAASPTRGHQLLRSFVFEQRSLLKEIGEVEAALRQIVLPTVVISGEWDVVVPPEVGRTITRAVAGAKLIEVPGVGHFVPRDAPHVVAEAVRSVEMEGEAPYRRRLEVT